VLSAETKRALSKGHDAFKILVSTARGRVSEEKIRLQEGSLVTPIQKLELARDEEEEQEEESLLGVLSGVDCSRYKDLMHPTKVRSPDFIV
jgi:hypothetical protein